MSSYNLLDLPNELIIYTFRHFLNLSDLWCLLQSNSKLRYFAATVIYKTWKIEVKTSSDMNINIQCRAILISLEILSNQLAFNNQYHLYSMKEPHNTIINNDISISIVNFLTAGPSINLTNPIEYQEGSAVDHQSIVCDESSVHQNEEDIIYHHQQWQLQQQNYRLNNKKMLMSDKIKLIKSLVLKEERLHTKIIEGISSYKHKFVLIEDIDTRNRIRTTVDVIFHHAVFVSAISRCRTATHAACITPQVNVHHRALSAVMVRLLTRLDSAFPSYCREITYTLADNIKAFLEYTGYKILAMTKANYELSVFSGNTSTLTRYNSIHELKNNHNHNSNDNYQYSNNNNNNNNNNDDHSHCLCSIKSLSPSLILTLQSIAACFDLIGAAFIGKLLGDSHVEGAIQRTCELLDRSKHSRSDVFLKFKRKLLVDLMDNWLNVKREVGSGEIYRFVRTEIDKCDEEQDSP